MSWEGEGNVTSAATQRAVSLYTEVSARPNHADRDQVSVTDTDGNAPEVTVAPIKVERGARYIQKCSVVARVLLDRRNHVRSSQWAILDSNHCRFLPETR